jgi:hypothetical protein
VNFGGLGLAWIACFYVKGLNMRKTILALTAVAAAGFAATPALAGVTFDTNTSTLLCNGVSGCTQNGNDSVTIGGLTLTYVAGTGVNIQPTSFINLGAIDATGTGSGDFTNVLLSITIDQTIPGGTGTLPGGDLFGIISGNQSGATITWLSGGVDINGYNYSVTNSPLSLVSPSSCIPGVVPAVCGVTSIQGQVAALPEPGTWGLMLLGFAGVGLALRRRRSPMLAQIA